MLIPCIFIESQKNKKCIIWDHDIRFRDIGTKRRSCPQARDQEIDRETERARERERHATYPRMKMKEKSQALSRAHTYMRTHTHTHTHTCAHTHTHTHTCQRAAGFLGLRVSGSGFRVFAHTHTHTVPQRTRAHTHN